MNGTDTDGGAPGSGGSRSGMVLPGRSHMRNLGAVTRRVLEAGEAVHAMQPVYSYYDGGQVHGPHPGSPSPAETLVGFAVDDAPARGDERAIDVLAPDTALTSAFFTGLSGDPAGFAAAVTLLTPGGSPYMPWLRSMTGAQVYASDARPDFVPAPTFVTSGDVFARAVTVAAAPAYDDLYARLALAAYGLGQSAKAHLDGLTMGLYISGFHTGNTPDGVPLFGNHTADGETPLLNRGNQTLSSQSLSDAWYALDEMNGCAEPIQGRRHTVLTSHQFRTELDEIWESEVSPDPEVASNQRLCANIFRRRFHKAVSDSPLSDSNGEFFLIDGRAALRPVVAQIVPTLTFDGLTAQQSSYSMSVRLITSVGYGDWRGGVGSSNLN